MSTTVTIRMRGREARTATVTGAVMLVVGVGCAAAMPTLAPLHLTTAALGGAGILLARGRWIIAAGLAASLAALVQPWYGLAFAPGDTSVLWEVGLLLVGFAVAAITLRPLPLMLAYLGMLGVELALVMANPEISTASRMSLCAVLTVFMFLGLAASAHRVETHRQSAHLEEDLRRAEARARTRAEEAEQARADLEATHLELVRSARLAALGELAAAVSHELNNPLAAIGLAVDGLREGADLDEELATLEEAAARCEAVTARLLDAVQVSAGQSGRLDLAGVARQSGELVRRHLELHGARLDVDADGEAHVHGDRAELTQLLLHLLQHAAGSGAAQVKLRVSNGGDEVRVEVADDGQGIPLDAHAALFQPSVDDGLGLSVCQDIVQRHGGQIQVRSGPGEGSRFTVLLPAHSP